MTVFSQCRLITGLVTLFAIFEATLLQAQDDGTIFYRGRTLEVEKFYDALSTSELAFSEELGIAVGVFRGRTEQYLSKVQRVNDGALTIGDYKKFTDFDISLRTIFGTVVSVSRRSLIFRADEKNTAKFNIVEISLDTGKVLTQTNYMYVDGFALSPDGSKIVFAARKGSPNEGAPTDVRILDLTTGVDRVIASDDTLESKFIWPEFSWSTDQRYVFASVLTKGDRTKGNVSIIPVDGSTAPQVLLPEKPGRGFVYLSKHSLAGDQLFFRAADDGTYGLFSVNIHTSEFKKWFGIQGADVTSFSATLDSHNKPYLVAILSNITGTKVYTYSEDSKEPSFTEIYKTSLNMNVLSYTQKSLIYKASGAETPSVLRALHWSGDPEDVALSKLSDDAFDIVSRCSVETVMIPTFDDLPLQLNGIDYKGKYFARIYRPKLPIPDAPKIAIVQAFYGGVNIFDDWTQVLCAAGVTVLSPAVRGGININADFERLNDGDLGGNEIFDLMYAGRWLVNHEGFDPKYIGTYGHSHGGYAAMRLMTFPDRLNGRERAFDWAFGVAVSGFSSIVGMYDLSNIKAWVSREAGGNRDNPEDVARWNDRSPIAHVASLRAPLLLVHGSEDRRVPYKLSKNLYDKAVEDGKGALVKLETIEGGGHIYRTLDGRLKLFRAWMKHMEAL